MSLRKDLPGDLRGALGEAGLLTGDDMAPWTHDWIGSYSWAPLCVARPRTTEEVSLVLRAAHDSGTAVVPVGGNTGLAGGTVGEGALMLSLDRMNKVLEVRPEARLARVEAGVILSELHDAVAAHGLSFPMTFGARGSARIGGMLATNAGGSNVLRHGNTRDLVLGLEAVLADGRVVDLMAELHKNNTGYDLRHLLIGSEGTLAVITKAVLKLVPAPRAFATAMVAASSMDAALALLNRLQEMTGGAVEAFEFMSASHMAAYAAMAPEARPPFEAAHEVNILVELGATAPRDVELGDDGQVPVAAYLEQVLAALFEEGALVDAVVASNESQRAAFWASREAAGEITFSRQPTLLNDVAVPVDKVGAFLEQALVVVRAIDAGAEPVVVAHLGDGNVHYGLWLTDAAHIPAMTEAVEDVVKRLGGSFSAEHGIGLTKRPTMARRKDAVALDVMQAIKAALDPKGILNPGKVLP